MKRSMWLVLVLVAVCNLVACEPPCNDGKCDDNGGAVNNTTPDCSVMEVAGDSGTFVLTCEGSAPVAWHDGEVGPQGANGTDGVDGVNGANGQNGVNGLNGANGTDGVDGQDGQPCTVSANNGVYTMVCPDGSSVSWHDGTDGVDGEDGEDFAQCDSSHPCATGESCNSQGICVIPGHDGAVGATGATGATGPQGPAGTNGTNGTSFVKCSTVHPCAANEQCNSQGICVIPDFVGCVENASCDDGNPCTTDDVCRTGICTGGSVNDCDDGNPATTDTCVAWIGCFNTTPTGCTTDAQCDDANSTTTDKCVAGKCVFTPVMSVPCYGLQFKLPIGAECIGWSSKPGEQIWVTDSATPDSSGWFHAPNGVCAVTCTAKPLVCRGEWSDNKVQPWQSAGCSDLYHQWDGTTANAPGCPWDGKMFVNNTGTCML